MKNKTTNQSSRVQGASETLKHFSESETRAIPQPSARQESYLMVDGVPLPLSQTNAKRLKTCLEILEADDGDATPFESLVDSLLVTYDVGSLEPNWIASLFADYKTQYEKAIERADYIRAKYPESKPQAAAV
jgi:hypothetical protein